MKSTMDLRAEGSKYDELLKYVTLELITGSKPRRMRAQEVQTITWETHVFTSLIQTRSELTSSRILSTNLPPCLVCVAQSESDVHVQLVETSQSWK